MTAVERYSPPDLTPAKWADLEKRADIYARSPLCPAHFKDKPDDLLVVAVTCHDLDVPFNTNTLNQFYVIDKKVAMMAQLQIALASRDQISVWFEDDEVSDTAATVCIRKPGTMEVHRYTYTADMARKAGLLDEWIEIRTEDGTWADSGRKKYKTTRVTVAVDGVPVEGLSKAIQDKVAKGEAKRKDPWFKSRQQMLMARASTMGLKIEAPHTTLGMAAEFDPGVSPRSTEDVDPVTGEVRADKDDDIVDAEIVEDDEPTRPGPEPDVADDWDRQPLLNRIAELADEFRDVLRKRWTAAQLPKIADPAFTKADEVVASRILGAIEDEAKEAYLNRQKRANAVMGEVGVRKDDERHAFVSMATGGATESTGHLTAEQCEAIATHAEALKEQQARNSDDEGGDPGPSEPELPLDEEPF